MNADYDAAAIAAFKARFEARPADATDYMTRVFESVCKYLGDLERFDDQTVRNIRNLIPVLQDCEEWESPIEVIMIVTLGSILVALSEEYFRIAGGMYFSSIVGPLILRWQAQLGNYRTDFLLETNLRSIVIECDGHEFHERTAVQASRDRRRDRDLQLAGHTVLRFTGSDIYRDPVACVKDIISATGSRP